MEGVALNGFNATPTVLIFIGHPKVLYFLQTYASFKGFLKVYLFNSVFMVLTTCMLSNFLDPDKQYTKAYTHSVL